MKLKPLHIAAGLALLGNVPLAFGQHKIVGTVSYNQATPLANVALSLDGSYDGATSAKDGSFVFETAETGPQVLIAKREGYQDVVQRIELTDTTRTLRVELIFTLKALGLREVVVGSKAFSEDKLKTQLLSTTDILTTATDGNVVTALKTLPGAQQVGESSDLFVRGGTGSETKMFMDGLLVNNFNYSSPANQASRSRFPAGLFKGAFFSSGGYSALYGQALSATLILESEDMPAESSADVGLSPLSVEGGLQLLSKDKKTLVGAALKYTDLTLVFGVLKPNLDFYQAPKYLDGSTFFKRKVGAGGLLKFYGSLGGSDLGLRQPDVNYPAALDQVRLRNTNLYSNLTYTQPIQRWKLYLGAGYSRNADRLSLAVHQNEVPLYDSAARDNTSLLQARAVLSRRVLNNGRLQWGGEVVRTEESLEPERAAPRRVLDTYSAGFAEVETYLTDRLSTRLGLRFENSLLLARHNLAPRAALNYALANKGLVSLAYGRFYQKPDRRYLLASPTLGFTEASHYILTYQKADNYYTLRGELFHKQYTDLVKTTPLLNNDGSGYARGLELFWRDKKTLHVVDYWVSYSFLDTKRDYLNYPFAVQPTFAARHTFTLVTKKYFPALRTNLSASYAFATGRPYYNPNLPTADFLQDRTNCYNNLGLSICYLPKLTNSFSVIALTVSNILGNTQIYGYNYSTLDATRRLPITPTNNPFIFLGLFMNFGVDRTNDIVNKSL